MSLARLTSAMLASALIRRANQQGGFAAILSKGDEISGAILVQALERGRFSGLFERSLGLDGIYEWRRTGPQGPENIDEIGKYLARRRATDPDLWIVELDIADAERFIVESG